jgi:hypothetical protein
LENPIQKTERCRIGIHGRRILNLIFKERECEAVEVAQKKGQSMADFL